MGKSGVCLRERCPEELSRKEAARAWSAFKKRADLQSAHSVNNVGNQLAERCLHTIYTKYRTFCLGSKRNGLELFLMCIYSEGDVDYLKLRAY